MYKNMTIEQKQHRKEYIKRWKASHPEFVARSHKIDMQNGVRYVTNYRAKNYRNWIGKCVRAARERSKGPSKNTVKYPMYRRVLDFDIDTDYACEVYTKQSGKCALSGIEMTWKVKDLCAISLDRIDSSHGYVKGNIQLVCGWVNLAKGNHSNEDLIACLRNIKLFTHQPIEVTNTHPD